MLLNSSPQNHSDSSQSSFVEHLAGDAGLHPTLPLASGEGGGAATTKVILGKYALGRLLGCGASAKVYHARNIHTGQTAAVKCISKSRSPKPDLAATVKREAAIMRRLRHPHVLRLFEVLASRSRIYFVLELARGGELFSRLAARGRLPEPQARRCFHQLISAVAYCHSRGVFHRDLKPENLLLDDAGNLKVSDFGLSALLPIDAVAAADHSPLLRTICGTPAYVAPEILAKQAYSGAAVDVWSCGVVLFVLAAGYLPFNDTNLMAMYKKIYTGQYRCPRWISPELRRLIGRLLDTNAEARITVEEILHDPWFMEGLDDEKWAAMTRLRGDGGDDRKEEAEASSSSREMNAFDIISFSSGIDLSRLFGEEVKRERFVVAGTPEAVVERAVEVAIEEGGMVVRRRVCEVAVEEWMTGRKVVSVAVHGLIGELVMVEVEKGTAAAAGRRWSGEFWKEKLKPSGVDPGTPGQGSNDDPVEPTAWSQEIILDNDIKS